MDRPRRSSRSSAATPAYSAQTPDNDAGSDAGEPAKRRRTTSKAGPAAKPDAEAGTGIKRPKGPKTIEVCKYNAAEHMIMADAGDYPYIQDRTCQGLPKEYKERCQACIEKQASTGACRFFGIRYFKANCHGKTAKPEDLVDYTFRSNQHFDEELVKFLDHSRPVKAKLALVKQKVCVPKTAAEKSRHAQVQNAEAELAIDVPAVPTSPSSRKEHADYVLPLIAPTFHPQVLRELRHERTHTGECETTSSGEPSLISGPRPFIRIRNVEATRSSCDICATSIFMGSYLCCCCGREFCLGCWDAWTPSGERKGSRVHRTDFCSRVRRHVYETMIFMTRAQPGEVALLEERVRSVLESTPSESQGRPGAGQGEAVLDGLPVVTAEYPTEDLKFLGYPKQHNEAMSVQTFRDLWRMGGVPLVMTGLREHFKLPWDDAYFLSRYGSSKCEIHDCDSGKAGTATVGLFFDEFSKEYDPKETTKLPLPSWKLKDWPPTADFAEAFPLLFRDFESAVPFGPQYTNRVAPYNLACYFPKDVLKPDLGPKMYNAYPAPDFSPLPEKFSAKKRRERIELNSKGTTNLHLDLTDAVNIMLYAAGGNGAPVDATQEKGIPDECGAIWDIFPPSAANPLRDFLRPLPISKNIDDPIHRQIHYLGEAALKELYQQGVQSYRIFQYPGDAVFIPAGCPHQVRNRRSSVKVAVDFVSPENVSVCRGLVEEARAMASEWSGSGGGGRSTLKDDVLQLWNCLNYTWRALEPFAQATKEVLLKQKGKFAEAKLKKEEFNATKVKKEDAAMGDEEASSADGGNAVPLVLFSTAPKAGAAAKGRATTTKGRNDAKRARESEAKSKEPVVEDSESEQSDAGQATADDSVQSEPHTPVQRPRTKTQKVPADGHGDDSSSADLKDPPSPLSPLHATSSGNNGSRKRKRDSLLGVEVPFKSPEQKAEYENFGSRLGMASAQPILEKDKEEGA